MPIVLFGCYSREHTFKKETSEHDCSVVLLLSHQPNEFAAKVFTA